MEVFFNNTGCFICGIKGAQSQLQQHHCIPQHLHPSNNVVAPVCPSCHAKLNSNDVAGMYSMLFKTQKILETSQNMIFELKKRIDSLEKSKSLGVQLEKN